MYLGVGSQTPMQAVSIPVYKACDSHDSCWTNWYIQNAITNNVMKARVKNGTALRSHVRQQDFHVLSWLYESLLFCSLIPTDTARGVTTLGSIVDIRVPSIGASIFLVIIHLQYAHAPVCICSSRSYQVQASRLPSGLPSVYHRRATRIPCRV